MPLSTFLRKHGHGILANEVFGGLCMFPFGLRVYRSRILPRIPGLRLMLNCFAYLLNERHRHIAAAI